MNLSEKGSRSAAETSRGWAPLLGPALWMSFGHPLEKRVFVGLLCYLLVVKVKRLFWLPSLLGSWSSGLAAKSCAPLVIEQR